VFITAHQRSLSSARSIQSYFLKIHFNIILPSTSGSSQCSFPSGFQMNILYVELICPMLSTCPAHLLHLDLIIIFCEEYKLCSFSLSCFLQPPVTLLLLEPNIVLSILFQTPRISPRKYEKQTMRNYKRQNLWHRNNANQRLGSVLMNM
jgi:hypothetical protein